MNKRTIATGIGILLVVVLAIVLVGKLAQPEVLPEQQLPWANETLIPPERPGEDNLSVSPEDNISQPTQPTQPSPRKNYTLRTGEPFMGIDADKLASLENGSFVRVMVGLVAEDQYLLEEVLATLNESEFRLSSIDTIFYKWFAGEISQGGLDKLKNDSRVSSFEQVRIMPHNLLESLDLATVSLGLDGGRINIGGDLLLGEGTTVCIIDSGIVTSDDAFSGKILAEHCYCDYNGTACCPNGEFTDTSAQDDYGHGTKIAKILTGNTKTKGVAPEAKIVVIKVSGNISNGSASTEDIGHAIDWCRGNKTVFNISVISLSYGAGNYSSPQECDSSQTAESINGAFSEGILFVTASGNEGHTQGLNFFSCPSNSTSVGGVYDAYVGLRPLNQVHSTGLCFDFPTGADNITCYTSRNKYLSLLAPADKIAMTVLGRPFGETQGGTSSAAPFVSGAALLLKQANPDWTPRQIRDILQETGEPINDTFNSRNNGPGTKLIFPRLDVLAALKLDWPTEYHDYQRTGFTVLKGDMPDKTELKTAQLVMKENISEEQVLRPSVADLDGNNHMDVVTVVHDKSSSTNPSTIYRYEVEKKYHIDLGIVKWLRYYNSKPLGQMTLQGGAVMSPPTLDDVDANGTKEVVVLLRNGTIAVLEPSGDALQLKWKRSFPQKATSTLGGAPSLEFNGGAAVVDLDLNGKKEIIFADTGLPNYFDWAAELIVLDGATGITLWSITYNNVTLNATPGVFAPVSVQNIDDDRYPEIIVPSYYGVYVFDYNDSTNSLQKRCNTPHGKLEGSAVVTDYDKDNEYELVYTTSTFSCGTGKTCYNKTYIVDAKNCTVEDSIQLENISRVTPVIGNLDTDGNMEVVISYGIGGTSGYSDEGYIKCYDLGNKSQDCFFNDNGNLHTSFVSPDLADINNDGKYEILFGENNGSNVYILNQDGTLNYTYDFGGFMDSALAIADIDGDNVAEIALKKAGSPITLLAIVSNNNTPPYFTQTIVNITAIEGGLINLNSSGTITAADPEGDALTFTYGSPFNSTGQWQTDDNDTGTYQILIEVSDGTLSDTQYVEVQVFNSTSYVQNNFTDGTQSKLFAFAGGENKSVTIRLPKDIIIQYAKLRLEGSN